METWPNFFIVGTAKAGTTSLWIYLNGIPGIYMSPFKEPNYFNRNKFPTDLKDPRQIRDKKKYLDLFKGVKDEKILGEASPGYLEDPEVPRLIYEVSPNSHILISLRDPIDRMFSAFLMSKKFGREKIGLSQIIKKILQENNFYADKYLRGSLYYENVKRYLDTFGKENVKIIIFEELIKNTKETMQEILKFLGINEEFQESTRKKYNVYGTPKGKFAEFVIRNKTIEKVARKIISPQTRLYVRDNLLIKKSKKPQMEESDLKSLQNIFTEDVQKISQLLDQKLPWKNFQD